MNTRIWRTLEQLEGGLPEASAPRLDERLGRQAAAAMGTALNVITHADVDAMKAGMEHTHRLMARLSRSLGAQTDSASFLSGRIAALADLLGLAAAQCADRNFAQTVGAAKFAPLLAALRSKPMTNAQLAAEIGQSKENVCRSLGDLRQAGAVLSHQRGREVFNDLSPAARAFLAPQPQAEKIEKQVEATAAPTQAEAPAPRRAKRDQPATARASKPSRRDLPLLNPNFIDPERRTMGAF